MKFLNIYSTMALALAKSVSAQDVFAHVVVGNTYNFNVSSWQSNIELAMSSGIDAFVLNVATPLSASTSQIANAFEAADQLGSKFKLFFSFDYLGGAGPWPASDVTTLLQGYTTHPSYYRYNNVPLVSTFEGTANINDWPSIRSSIPDGIFFMPDWTSLGPSGLTSHLNIVDGFFSWDMWPADPSETVPTSDNAWIEALQGKPYMMGVSPWFYTNLPAYNKAWVFNVDKLWYDRWEQALKLQPQFIQLVTWNDFGESHYIGPIYQPGIPASPGADATTYVDGMPHDAWRDLLPYYIASYKNKGTPVPVADEKLLFWYRRTPKAAGSPGAVIGGNYGATFPANALVQDFIYLVALVGSAPGTTISLSIGGNAATTFSNITQGANILQVPFAGQTGAVAVQMWRDGSVVMEGTGATIDARPVDGITNYNAWVGSASASSAAA